MYQTKGVYKFMANDISLVAIDHGYDSIKVFDGKKIFSFKSKYETTKDNINRSNTYHIRFGSDEYIVGDGASINYIEYDKTANEYNQIFTLAALGKVMGAQDYCEFNIVAGYPLNLYAANRSVFAKYLKSKNVVEFYFNGQKKKVLIKDCLVFPQGIGAVFTSPNQYKNKLIAVLDVGGLTVNGGILNNLNLDNSTMFTINQGCLILFNRLKKVLNSTFTQNIQEYEIPNIIENGLIINGQKVKADKIIDDVIFQHCNTIRAECRRFNWNVDTLDILLVGGGALVLDGYIQEVIPQIKVIDDPVFANVKGFYEVGRHYYANIN